MFDQMSAKKELLEEILKMAAEARVKGLHGRLNAPPEDPQALQDPAAAGALVPGTDGAEGQEGLDTDVAMPGADEVPEGGERPPMEGEHSPMSLEELEQLLSGAQ